METLDFKDKDIEPRVCGNCINFETVPINDDSSEHVLEKGFCRILKEIVNIETEACDDWEFRGNQIPDILKGPFCEAVVLDEIPNIDLVDFYERLIGRKDEVLRDYYKYYSPDCGTKYRGCAPDCPKRIFEETGVWTRVNKRRIMDYKEIVDLKRTAALL